MCFLTGWTHECVFHPVSPGYQTMRPFISFMYFHNGIFYLDHSGNPVYFDHIILPASPFIFQSAVGASVGAVPHPGGWALLQWARLWTLPWNSQWHPELTGIWWQHPAGHRQMGHAGTDAQPLAMLQRGRTLTVSWILRYSFRPFRCLCELKCYHCKKKQFSSTHWGPSLAQA